MGLAGAKDRRKIGKDPNNTRWARRTDNFGQRILRAQGWEPGQYLGPQDASHAEFHTAASASHVRVAPREDGLGLGARRNRGDECTGLDDLNDLLGRLNGRPAADLDADRRARAEVRLGHYVERRFGRMRFVSGGFLGRLDGLVVEEGAGDGAPLGEEEAEVSQEFSQEETSDAVREKRRKEKKAKKRKARNEDPGSEAGSSRKEKKRKAKAGDDQSTEPPASAGEDVRESRSKKRKSKKDRGTAGDSAEDSTVATVKTRSRTDTLKESGESMPSSEAEAPAMSGRHLARKRFIAQKRRALMDEQALKQIFMIKT